MAAVTTALVTFCMSTARAICSHARNVPDEVLAKLANIGGLVMINFNNCFLRNDCKTHRATEQDVVKHINHVRKVAGVDHIGIG